MTERNGEDAGATEQLVIRLIDPRRWSPSKAVKALLSTDITEDEASALSAVGSGRAALETMVRDLQRTDPSIRGLLMIVMRDGCFGGFIELRADEKVPVWQDARPRAR